MQYYIIGFTLATILHKKRINMSLNILQGDLYLFQRLND